MYIFSYKPMTRRCVWRTALAATTGARWAAGRRCAAAGARLRLPRGCRHGSVLKVSADFGIDGERGRLDGSFVL